MPTLLIPTPLRSFTGGAATFEAPAEDVHGLLVGLATAYPALRPHLFDASGAVRTFLRIYLGDTDIEDLQGAVTALTPDAEVLIVPAIAGGNAQLP